MNATQYTACQTNADLAELHRFYVGGNLDIATTIIFKKFTEEGGVDDYMVTIQEPGKKTEVFGVMLSDRSQQIRDKKRDEKQRSS